MECIHLQFRFIYMGYVRNIYVDLPMFSLIMALFLYICTKIFFLDFSSYFFFRIAKSFVDWYFDLLPSYEIFHFAFIDSENLCLLVSQVYTFSLSTLIYILNLLRNLLTFLTLKLNSNTKLSSSNSVSLLPGLTISCSSAQLTTETNGGGMRMP